MKEIPGLPWRMKEMRLPWPEQEIPAIALADEGI